MREIDELYADSGEPVKESHGVSRGTALKVGGLGLAGALAAFMPGRAGAAVRKKASNASCQGTGFVCIGSNKAKACGTDNYSLGNCFCGTVYYGKLHPKGAPVGACVENSFCVTADPCTQQKDCGAGYVCISSTCCTNFGYAPQLCLHYCEQGSQGQAPKLNVHKTAAHK
jgi:hypothetical protein